MKKHLIVLALSIIMTGTGFAMARDSEHHVKESSETKSYYCPMHPEVTQDKAGKCPKCDMNLEKMDSKDETKHSH